MQMYSSFLFNFSSNSPLFVKGSVGNITATIFKRKKARFSCWFITINTSFDLHFLFCVSNHYIETLVNQFKYIIALRQPIQYAKGNVLFKIIDLTGYILTFFLQGQSRLHLSVGFFWLLADSLLRLPIPRSKLNPKGLVP